MKSNIRNGTTMGGDTKRQKTTTETETEKVEEKVDKAGSVDFAELRDDLFREAAQLVSDVPSTKIAVFVTPPPSEKSDVAMYAFGYPSVKSVVKTFLEDNRSTDPAPAKNEKAEDEDDAEDGSSQGFWWEDAKQFESMNPEQLDAAYDWLVTLRDRMILVLEARGEGSGNQKDLPHNDDKALPKP